MTFNYEQSLWGRGTATLAWSSPTALRLRPILQMLKKLAPNSTVLEIGCGAGQFIRGVKYYRPDLLCHGSDISERAIEAAKQYNDGVLYQLSEEKVLLYEAHQFDAVIISDVLEHVADPAALLAEVKRVLKPGGLFYCFIPCEGDYLSVLFWLYKWRVIDNLSRKFAGHVNQYSRKKWLKLLAASSLRPVRVRYGEQLLGQIAVLITYLLLDRRARRRGLPQVNNEAYYTEFNQTTRRRRWYLALKKFGNIAVNLESILLARIPSPNMHVICNKQ